MFITVGTGDAIAGLIGEIELARLAACSAVSRR